MGAGLPLSRFLPNRQPPQEPPGGAIVMNESNLLDDGLDFPPEDPGLTDLIMHSNFSSREWNYPPLPIHAQ